MKRYYHRMMSDHVKWRGALMWLCTLPSTNACLMPMFHSKLLRSFWHRTSTAVAFGNDDTYVEAGSTIGSAFSNTGSSSSEGNHVQVCFRGVDRSHTLRLPAITNGIEIYRVIRDISPGLQVATFHSTLIQESNELVWLSEGDLIVEKFRTPGGILEVCRPLPPQTVETAERIVPELPTVAHQGSPALRWGAPRNLGLTSKQQGLYLWYPGFTNRIPQARGFRWKGYLGCFHFECYV